MASAPRPDILTWSCAGLLVAPVVIAVVAGASLALIAPAEIGGPAGLGAVLALVGGIPLLVVEYYAILRGCPRATRLVAWLTLYFALMGSIAWLAGLLVLLRLTTPVPDSMSPVEFLAYSAVLACLILVGLGHLRWHRLLKSAVDPAVKSQMSASASPGQVHGADD